MTGIIIMVAVFHGKFDTYLAIGRVPTGIVVQMTRQQQHGLVS
jgi:hypothetical protein